MSKQTRDGVTAPNPSRMSWPAKTRQNSLLEPAVPTATKVQDQLVFPSLLLFWGGVPVGSGTRKSHGHVSGSTVDAVSRLRQPVHLGGAGFAPVGPALRRASPCPQIVTGDAAHEG